MNNLTPRELAIFIWISVAVIFVLCKKTIRDPLFQAIKSSFAKKIIMLYILAFAYIVLSVFILYRLEFWDKLLIKKTCLWTLTFASVSLFKINEVSENKKYFIEAIKRNLKLTLIFEFILDFYSPSLFVELLIVPIGTSMGILISFADMDAKYKSVKKFLASVLTFSGIVYMVIAFYYLCTHFNKFAIVDNAKDFLLNPILSLMFLPFIYILSVYMEYEVAFIGLDNIFKSTDMLLFAKVQAFLRFNTNLEGLKRWKTQLFIDELNTKKDIIFSIESLINLQRVEKHPPYVDPEFGWSPYSAKDFLLNEGLKTGFYGGTNNDWLAYGRMKVNGSVFDNSIAYSISGSSKVARTLELELDIFDKTESKSAVAMMVKYARALYQNALNGILPTEIEVAISKRENWIAKIDSVVLSVNTHNWGNTAGWYSIIFTIEHNGRGGCS